MFQITLKDGSVKKYESKTNAFDITKDISMGLARNACAVLINDKICDLRTEIDFDCKFEVLTFENEDGQKAFNHTASHILAEAVLHLFPNVKFAIGPAIKNGFYYDFDLDHPFTAEEMDKIEEEMYKIIKSSPKIEKFELSVNEAMDLMKDQPYKIELIKEHAGKGENISFYKQDDFVDLCAGPHLIDVENMKAIKLTSVTGAYWRGDEKNKMLSRIYGTAFPKKSMLDEYLTRIEEAKKRDHRKLGKQLQLFFFRDEAPGMAFYLPKGMTLRNTLIDYWRHVHKKWDYVEIMTPQIMKRTLWETSGHWDHYKENMYTTSVENEDFAIKPMNCPGSILAYEFEPHSYKDLPLRYGELGNVHRYEKSGELHGMFRVRAFTQDDAHILLTKDQIKDEVIRIASLFDEVYEMFGLPYTIELSTMPDDHIGTKEDWDIATNALASAIESIGKTYVVNPGDGAFYGPKLDFHIEDSLGRTWQCGTIQLDYQLPGRFNLEYIGADSEKHTPVMIHRVVFGSIERFIGVITEHFAGAFPTWLAPVQVELLPIADRHIEYLNSIKEKLEANGIRCEIDARNEKIGYKIREAQLQKIPYMIVAGDRDVENNSFALRTRSGGEEGNTDINTFLNRIIDEVKNHKL